MLLYEILNEGAGSPEDMLRFPFEYGTTTINVTASILPEEKHLYSPEALEAMKKVTVFSIHRSPLSGDLDRQDLMKLRGAYSQDTHGKYVEDMVDRGVARLVDRRGARIDTQIERDWRSGIPQKHLLNREGVKSVPRGKTSQEVWNAMQDLMNDSKSMKTVVPMPSSSPLVGMITKAIVSRVPNTMVSDVLYKTDPMFSDMAASQARPNHDPASPRTRTVGNVKQRIQTIEAQLEGDSPNAQELQTELVTLRKWLDKQPGFSAKSQYANPRTNYGKWLYGWMQARKLSGDTPHDVILVDDNVVSGNTISVTVKGLMATNPNIRSVRVLVLHQLRNPPKPKPDDSW